ncbi:MAG: tryptophanase [Candidatus Marinimicrobia bacterium]|nr:tryptophanase [Candidatus Neomarinimicrobiota bacterium]
MPQYIVEPFRIKVVEPIKKTTREERAKILETAGNNVFNIPSEKVYIDLLTDSGTGAMSDNQWAGIHLGDESYAHCRNWFHFEETVMNITGLKHVIPTHQGRVAENLLFSTILKREMVVPNNNHFDTTRANILANGGIPLDMVIEEGRDPEAYHPFKGNVNVKKLEDTICKYGQARIPLVMITVTNNSGGGQPVSMENIRSVRALCDKYGIPLFFDACRFAENAYFIKMREENYRDKDISEIVREMFSYVDGCTMSAKKDALVNIGGFIAVNDDSLAGRLKEKLILIEGFFTYGGLAGRDLEAVSRGLVEAQDEDYLAYRVGQVKYLGDCLEEAGVPCLKPTGGHAVYVNARKFLDHIPQCEFPGQSLVVNLYLHSGIRATEIGSYMFAYKDPKTGEANYPDMDLVRLALPRRVYTGGHLNYVAESLKELYAIRYSMKGMRIVEHGESALRHFVARLEFIKEIAS